MNDEKDLKIQALEEENKRLKIAIRDLTDKLFDKNQQINRLQNDSWDDLTPDRDY